MESVLAMSPHRFRSRDLLDVATGKRLPDEIQDSDKCEFLEMLPKDIIQYLQGYTGVFDCYHAIERTWDYNIAKYIIRHFVWCNTTKADAERSRNNLQLQLQYSSTDLKDSKLIFIDGSPYVAMPIPKKNIYGLPKEKKRKIAVEGKSTRCTGRNMDDKRCKRRVGGEHELCVLHR